VNWLVLFDVDGTLLLTHDEVYVEANRLALNEVYGTAPDGPDVPGDTATAHTRRALAAAGFSTEQIDAGLTAWCKAFAAHYVRLLAGADTSHWEAGPGAHEAVAATAHPALLTGNPPAVAHARMQRLGLATYFPRGTAASAASGSSAPSSSPSRASGGATGRRSARSESATPRSTYRARTRPDAAASR